MRGKRSKEGFERVGVGVRLGSCRGCGGQGRGWCERWLREVGEVQEAPGTGEERRGGLVVQELLGAGEARGMVGMQSWVRLRW